ncbi:MAG: protein kinase domain-containing protein [Myxococcota bacterium]
MRKLATGGMAEVFLAKVSGPGGFEKSLVIKRILPNLAKNPEFVSMFLQEARIAAQFAHPSVVQIFDFGEVNNSYFIAMEYVDGPNLRTLLRAAPQRRIPLHLGARIIEEACEGLAYVHEFADPNGVPMGLMHCDVSTDNLLIARNGAVKVVDFGLATTAADLANATPGTVKGKIAYMPPEQIIGEADLRADVYALGVILYEIAAGTRPYEQQSDPQLLEAIIKSDPVPLLTRRPDVPREYALIVQKAMAKSLAERFQNCRELAAALEEFISNTGERVSKRHIAALVASSPGEAPNPSRPGSTATPISTSPSPTAVIGPPASLANLSTPPPKKDPFGAIGQPVAKKDPFASIGTPLPSKPKPPDDDDDPFAVFGTTTPAPPRVPAATKPASPPKPSSPRAEELFNQFFSDLDDVPDAPAPAPAAPPPPPEEDGGMRVTVGTGTYVPPLSSRSGVSEDSGGMNVTTSGAPFVPPPRGSLPTVTPGPKGAYQPLTNLTPGPRSTVTPGPRPLSNNTPGPRPLSSTTPGPKPAQPPLSNLTPRPAQPPPSNLTPTPRPAQPPLSNLTPGPKAAQALQQAPLSNLTPGPRAAQALQQPPPRSSPSQAQVPPSSSPSQAVQPAQSAAEIRAAVVLADASAMRLYEPGTPLAPLEDLEKLRDEVERDEGVLLAVRFACHAPRLLKAMDNAEGLIAERVVGAVEGLLVAEAYGALATMLERLRATADLDAQHRRVFELALEVLLTADQVRRIIARMREAPPADAEGLSRLMPFFGPAFAAVWLDLSENLDLPASRDAVLPGLAALAGLKPEPFLERLAPKRPRRIAELVYCVERGRIRDHQRVVRELLARLDPSRQREVLSGLARAQTDDAFRHLGQALSDQVEETRVLAMQLLGKYFPERSFELLGDVVPGIAQRAESERRALWTAIGHSTSPAAFALVSDELSQKPSLLNRAKVEARKLDVLEGLAVMKQPGAAELLRRVSQDAAQPDSVRAAADRHVRSAMLVEAAEQTASGWTREARRWDRNPPAWRDVVVDLSALAAASRLLELSSSTFDVVFDRIAFRVEALLRGGTSSVTTSGALMVNGTSVHDGAEDAAIDRALKAFQARSISSFTFSRRPSRQELEHLARWLAAGGAAEGVDTPSISRALSTAVPARPAPVVKTPTLGDASREVMVRYVELVLAFRAWLSERKLNPQAAFPETRQTFVDLAAAVKTHEVRFLGLLPKSRNRDAELFHGANVLTMALVFGAELGLPSARLVDLASYAFFTDVGNLELKDETFERAGRLTEEDHRDVTLAKQRSARFPFVKLGDSRMATAWATAVAEQELDAAGRTAAQAQVGLLASIVALARAFESLTTATATREAMTPAAAAEVLTQKVAHRFRPELLAPFTKFASKFGLRPLIR